MADLLLSGKVLLDALEKTGITYFPRLPEILRDSIVENVPAEVRLRGIDDVKKYLTEEQAENKTDESNAQTTGAQSTS